MINTNLVHNLAKYFKDIRYEECNYYMADTLLAAAALEWAVERLQGRFGECLNATEGVCDLWYLESHSECKLLMAILYDFTADEKYNPQFSINYTDSK